MRYRVIILTLVGVGLLFGGAAWRTAVVQSAQPEQYVPKSLVNATQEEVASDIMSFVKANFDSPGVEPRILRLEIVPHIDYVNRVSKQPFDDENGRVQRFPPGYDPKSPVAVVLVHGNFISKPGSFFGKTWEARAPFLFLRMSLLNGSYSYIMPISTGSLLNNDEVRQFAQGLELPPDPTPTPQPPTATPGPVKTPLPPSAYPAPLLLPPEELPPTPQRSSERYPAP